MAQSLRLVGVTKTYNRRPVVDHINLEIAAGQFYTLLGPSGCGKTTTLRMIAGLERADGGTIYLGDRVISSPENRTFVEPEKRGMGMVFQSYAVWPHMTVGGNVGFPLKERGVPAGERHSRVAEALELVGLKGFESRPATQLSGGQQQRVALARALVYRPEVLLLDEPLSNLDAKLREQMRTELRDLQRRMNMTTIFVTHDQIEAMAVSDRVVVMSEGKIEQIGTPEEIYQRPKTPFVMDFLGQVNYLPCVVIDRHGGLAIQGLPDVRMVVPLDVVGSEQAGEAVTLCIRPEDLQIVGADARQSSDWPGVVQSATFLGQDVDYVIKVGESRVRMAEAPTPRYSEGTRVWLRPNLASTRIWPRINATPAIPSAAPEMAAATAG